MAQYPNTHTVVFTYKNHRGEISVRMVTPYEFRFKRSQWHDEPQHFLDGWDHDKQAFRTFAMKDITGWRPVTAEELAGIPKTDLPDKVA